eukprot:4665722-Pleurochrysis_carterae.AAC.1
MNAAVAVDVESAAVLTRQVPANVRLTQVGLAVSDEHGGAAIRGVVLEDALDALKLRAKIEHRNAT